MNTSQESRRVRDIIALYENKMLIANPEYQRGAVWRPHQKKKLIDSIFRGYPIPLIYLHYIKRSVAGMQQEGLEVIDGQQRIVSIYEFSKDHYALFDPIKDDREAKFPAFIKAQPCPWAGKSFSTLSEELQHRLLDMELSIAKIETSDNNEVRDLFVRLQSGLPLNAQEARDAWPGEFTDFVLSVGGKPELPGYAGHVFFQGLMGLNQRTDRGKTRQLVAQLAMLFFSHREKGINTLPDINAMSINEFYFTNVDFNKKSADAQRFVNILDKLDGLLRDGKRPKLKAHDAIHLLLLVDALWDDYTRSWEPKLAGALDKFREKFVSAKANKDAVETDEFWKHYGQWTRVNSDRGERIAHRHTFYADKMLEYLSPLKMKDPSRSFGELEREIIYFRSHKSCAACGADVRWDEAEIHHVVGHSEGGQTTLENAALVHKHCHPKGDAATREFAKKFFGERQKEKPLVMPKIKYDGAGYLWKHGKSRLFMPHGTEVRMTYKKSDFVARIEGNDFVYEEQIMTPGSMANAVTNSRRNAWRDLWVKLPSDHEWRLANDLRDLSDSSSSDDVEL